MRTADRKTVIAVAVGVVLVAAVVIGLVRSVDATAPPPPAATNTQTPASRPGTTAATPDPTSVLTAEGGAESPVSSSPTSTVPPDDGPGHDDAAAGVPAAEKPRATSAAGRFWSAFSTRDPKARDRALAKTAVPYLTAKMSVPSTDRIPVVKVARSAVVGGSFSTATVVSATADTGWWSVVLVYDPADDSWKAQSYDTASAAAIADAQREMKGRPR